MSRLFHREDRQTDTAFNTAEGGRERDPKVPRHHATSSIHFMRHHLASAAVGAAVALVARAVYARVLRHLARLRLPPKLELLAARRRDFCPAQ